MPCSTRWRAFADAVRSGKAAGATGKTITDIVNIGIGGSDLGPAMATLALAPYARRPARALRLQRRRRRTSHDTLKGLDRRDDAVHHRLEDLHHRRDDDQRRDGAQMGAEGAGRGRRRHHFAAVSTALDKVAAFGIAPDRVFGFWDWVGGRYSLWSAIGLPIMIAVGPRNFRAVPRRRACDGRAFPHRAAARRTCRSLLGLVGYWHRVVCGYPARAVIPYDQRLSRLAGLSAAARHGIERQARHARRQRRSTTPTGPLVWGEPGTNGQHAFFQLLHQGTDVIPVEFIAAADRPRAGPASITMTAARQLPGAVGGADEGPHAGRGARRRCWPRA